jgi:methylglutaconyl-CoA hydratase
LTLQIGDKRARDLLLTGRLFEAEEGYRLGLVTEVVSAEGLAGRVKELSEALAAGSGQAVGATKRLLLAQNKAWLDAAIEESMAANARAREMEDFGEGVASFLEKRKPVWHRPSVDLSYE